MEHSSVHLILFLNSMFLDSSIWREVPVQKQIKRLVLPVILNLTVTLILIFQININVV
jgi:hypothetical protein